MISLVSSILIEFLGMSKKTYGWLFVFSVVIIAILIGPKIQKNLPEVKINIPEKQQLKNNMVITRVVDGDTVEVENGIKIRYIGINSPETKDPRKRVECFGVEAYEFNKSLVEGKNATLEKDVSETDKYGRLLRYVWVEEKFINEEMVKQGFASIATYPPDVKYYKRLLDAQNYAKNNQLGLWKKCKI